MSLEKLIFLFFFFAMLQINVNNVIGKKMFITTRNNNNNNPKQQIKESLVSFTSSSTLRQLHLLFRHGDRTPFGFYGNDPYKNYSFPEGIGSLILKGVERMYHYGEVLRTIKYGQFLGMKLNKCKK